MTLPRSTAGAASALVALLACCAGLLAAWLPDTTRLRVFATAGTPMTTIDFTMRGRFVQDSLSAFYDGCLFDALARSACLTDSIVQRVDNGDTIVTVAGIGSV